MTGQSPKARRPQRAPTRQELAERDVYADRTARSVEAIRDSVRNWRNGLTGFITLVTTGIVIKGRETTTGLDTTWRATISSLIAIGLVMTTIGLWLALAAETAVDWEKRSLTDIRAEYGSLISYDVARASQAARKLNHSVLVVGFGAALLLTGLLLTWWAPYTK